MSTLAVKSHFIRVKEIGPKFVELITHPALLGKAGEAESALKSAGHTAGTLHGPTGPDADIAHPDPKGREKALRLHEEYLQLSESLGAKYYVIHPGIDVYLDQAGGRWDEAKKVIKFERNEGELARLWRINAKSLATLGDFASDLEVRIALETGPTNLITVSETLKIVEDADRDNIGICVDTGHVNVGGSAKPQDAIKEAGELLWALHLHDNNGGGDLHLPPGRGSIDWPAVVRALGDVSYRGTYNVELAYLDWETDSAWNKAKESVSFLSAVLG